MPLLSHVVDPYDDLDEIVGSRGGQQYKSQSSIESDETPGLLPTTATLDVRSCSSGLLFTSSTVNFIAGIDHGGGPGVQRDDRRAVGFAEGGIHGGPIGISDGAHGGKIGCDA